MCVGVTEHTLTVSGDVGDPVGDTIRWAPETATHWARHWAIQAIHWARAKVMLVGNT